MMASDRDRELPSFGYLVPTRDAVTLDRPQTQPLLALGERAEELGFDALWVGDSPLARARHDALLMIAALAARTERVTLGTAVLLPALRAPLLLAQAAATADLLTQGRFVLGVGAGFPFPETERQFEAVGVPYAGRVGRMRETIAAARLLWLQAGKPVTFAGQHVQLEGVALAPAPHQAGGPPVWMAGAGEAAERRVGSIADGWLPYPPSAEQYATGLERVHEAAAAAERPAPTAGLYVTLAVEVDEDAALACLRRNVERYYRQPLEIMRQIQAMYAGTPEGFVAWLEPYLRAGAQHVVLRVADENAERGLESAAEAAALVVGSSTATAGGAR